jgi:hypothetical protein
MPPQQQDWFSQFEAPIPRKAKEQQDWFSQFENKTPEPAQPSTFLDRAIGGISKILNPEPPRFSEQEVRELQSPEPRGLEKLPGVGEYLRGRRLEGAKNIQPGQEIQIGGEPNQESILPKFKQPETWWGGFGAGLYNEFVRPLASEAGALGNASPEKLPPLFGEGVSKIGPLAPPQEIPKPPARKLLQEAPVPKQLGQGARFIAGPAGIAERGKTYPLDLGELPVGELGSVLPRETGETVQLPAETAAARGTSLGTIPKISLPKKGEVVNLNDLNEQIRAAMSRPTQIGEPPEYSIGRVGPVEQPSAPLKPSRRATPISDNSVNRPTIQERPAVAPTEAKPTEATTPPGQKSVKITQIETGERPIPVDATPEEATRQFTNGQAGAAFKGNTLAKKFSDLSDPSLIDKYEQGDRTGRLKDVADYFEQRWQQARQVGFLEEDQRRLNYLRHYFQQSPEEVTAAYKAYIAKNPQFAKLGKFPTYAAGEGAGLTRKFQTIPEIMGAYETEYQKGLRNKEFYDYLKNSKQLAAGSITTKPTEWTFRGPNAEKLKTYVSNFYSESPSWVKALGGIGSYTKNLFLGSGVPGTPLNMHFYNTAKSKFYAEGMSGLADYFKNTFSPAKDKAYLESKADFIGELIDRGFQHNIEGHTAFGNAAEEAAKSNRLMQFAKTIRDFQGKVFEDPLFKIHLPAQKVQLAENVYNDALKQGLDKESALKQAATISNDVMGGIDRTLRHATTKNLSSFGVVAPDWLESRFNMAIKGAKALVGKENPIYAKALGRKVALGAAGAGATAALTGQPTNPSQRASNITSVPAGQTSTGLNREVPLYGTTAEELRIPAEIAKAAATPGQSVGERISGLGTGRINAPLKAGLNIVMNRDPFGNPLYGKDRFGRPIPPGQQILNLGKELARPLTPPWLSMGGQILSGDDLERALAQGLELPINYNKEPAKPGMRRLTLQRRR